MLDAIIRNGLTVAQAFVIGTALGLFVGALFASIVHAWRALSPCAQEREEIRNLTIERDAWRTAAEEAVAEFPAYDNRDWREDEPIHGDGARRFQNGADEFTDEDGEDAFNRR